MPTLRDRWLAIIYAAAIFVSAFLLFQIQPLISKRILPWFGGSPAVWTTCLALLPNRPVRRLRLRPLVEQPAEAAPTSPRPRGCLSRSALILMHVFPAKAGNPPAPNAPFHKFCSFSR